MKRLYAYAYDGDVEIEAHVRLDDEGDLTLYDEAQARIAAVQGDVEGLRSKISGYMADNITLIASLDAAMQRNTEALREIDRLRSELAAEREVSDAARNAFTQLERVRGMDTLDYLQMQGERDAARAALDATAQATSCHSCVRGDGTDVIAELVAERDSARSRAERAEDMDAIHRDDIARLEAQRDKAWGVTALSDADRAALATASSELRERLMNWTARHAQMVASQTAPEVVDSYRRTIAEVTAAIEVVDRLRGAK